MLSDGVQIHGPGSFTHRDYLLWLTQTPDTLLGLDVESTPLENSKKATTEHKRGIYYPGYTVRTVQIADHDSAWILDPTTDIALLRATIDLGKEFVSFTGIDQQAIRLSLGVDIDAVTHDCHHLATLVQPGGFQNGLKALTVKFLDKGLADAEAVLDAYAKETAPTGHKVGDKLQAWKWALDITVPEVVEYAGLDAIYVLHLYDVLRAMLGHCENLIGRERWLGTLSVRQQYKGLLVDKDYAQARYDEVAQLHAQASERLVDVWNGPALSPKRLEWLADNGLPFEDLIDAGRIKLTDGGVSGNRQPCLDKVALKFLAAEYKDDPTLAPVLVDMLTVSENSNLKTNLRSLLAHMDIEDRVHPNVKIMGAITGRQSVTNPPMQTFKKDDPRLRGCFIADPGMSFVSCDFQNVEVRVAAALAGDRALADMVSKGGSMHINNAHAIFGEWITNKDPRYRVAKIGTFASLYGASAVALSGQLGLPLGDAQDFKNKLIAAYPEAFLHYPRKMSRLKEVVTDWGRVIPLQRGFEYKAANFAIQSSARELLVDSVRRLVTKFGIKSDWVWLLVHDETIIQCPTRVVDEVADTLAQSMTSEYRGVPVTADVEILGARWRGIEQ